MTAPTAVAASPGRGGSIAARMRAYGRSDRIVGVDIARGLAVLGMFGAHVGVTQPFDWAEPATWTGLVNGRPSILFALLAGVSIAIISGRPEPLEGNDLARARVRIVTRAAFVFLIGVFLDALGTNVAVIFTYYGVFFLLALPFLRWKPRALFTLAGALTVVVPPILMAINENVDPYALGAAGVPVELLATGYYPALLWIVFVLTGIGVGRLDLASTRVRLALLGVGTGMAIAGYGLGALASAVVGPGEWWAALATTEPHSGSPFEVVGSTGFALAVLGMCLLASRVIRWVLFPLAAVGATALTTYTAQVVAIAVLGIPVPGTTDNTVWVWFVIVTLALCSIWVILFGRGPLERLLSRVSYWMAGPAVPEKQAPKAP